MAPSNECLTEEICELNEGTAKSLHMVQLHYLGRGHLVVAVAISISQCRDRMITPKCGGWTPSVQGRPELEVAEARLEPSLKFRVRVLKEGRRNLWEGQRSL